MLLVRMGMTVNSKSSVGRKLVIIKKKSTNKCASVRHL